MTKPKKTAKKTSKSSKRPSSKRREPQSRRIQLRPPSTSSAGAVASQSPSSAGALAFEGRQAMIAGVAPSSIDAQPGDELRTVMTIRTTRGEVRRWALAASKAGHTFPMTWALHVLKRAATAQIAGLA